MKILAYLLNIAMIGIILFLFVTHVIETGPPKDEDVYMLFIFLLTPVVSILTLWLYTKGQNSLLGLAIESRKAKLRKTIKESGER